MTRDEAYNNIGGLLEELNRNKESTDVDEWVGRSKMVYKVDKEEKVTIMDRLKELVAKIDDLPVAKDEDGTTSVEYAMLVVVIACVAVLGFELLGGSVKGILDVANTLLPFGK